MTAAPIAAAGRERRYRILDLPERDALVFKSVVKVLSGKTRDRWVASSKGPVDLMIARADSPGPQEPDAPVLRVTMPVRPEDLWGQLDRVSAQLEMERDTFRPSRPEPPAAPAATGGGGGRRLQLLRWPPDELLRADLRYLRLATMLGARPFTVDELAQRSSLPLAACHAFAAVLHANGIAQWLIDPEPAEGGPDAAQAGLIGRIRSRLGLD